jgi:hypothetical protein
MPSVTLPLLLGSANPKGHGVCLALDHLPVVPCYAASRNQATGVSREGGKHGLGFFLMELEIDETGEYRECD